MVNTLLGMYVGIYFVMFSEDLHTMHVEVLIDVWYILLLITKRLGFEIKDSLKYHATIILRGCVIFQ